MANVELTGGRKTDLIYSHFRRDPRFVKSYFIDIDVVEYRYYRGIVAIKETKMGFNNYPTAHQHLVYTEMASGLRVPYYIVQYITEPLFTDRILKLRVIKGDRLKVEGQRGSVVVKSNLVEGSDFWWMTPEQYIDWVNNL